MELNNAFVSAPAVGVQPGVGSVLPCRVVLMGVSGCGKSSLGVILANELGWHFVEGDGEHGSRNIAKMAAGQPLSDDDRAGWLDRLASLLADARKQGRGLVMSCSALKRSYRDRLRAGDPGLKFVHLQGGYELIAGRMAKRSDHYMPASLLQSQFADLQVPGEDESVITLNVELSSQVLAQSVLSELKQNGCTRHD